MNDRKMKQKINSDSSFNTAMLASRSFENILQMIKTSNLNYFIQLSPFAAQISLKKSLVRDKSGVPLAQPSQTSFDCTSDDVTDLLIKNHALENKLASLQKDYEAAQATIKENEEERKPLDDDPLSKCDELEKEKKTPEKKKIDRSNSIKNKSKESGKIKKQKQKSRQGSCREPPVIPSSEQSLLEIASSPIKPSSLDSNYNVKVSNLFSLLDSEESLSMSTAKPPSSPPFRDKPPCAPVVTASSAALSPQTSLGTPKPPVTASPETLSPRTPSGTPPRQEPVNPVMVFEGKPISTKFACKKIKEAFEEINNRFNP